MEFLSAGKVRDRSEVGVITETSGSAIIVHMFNIFISSVRRDIDTYSGF